MAMMLLGALFVFMFGQSAIFLPQPETWSEFPGGNVTVAIPGQANVTVTLSYEGGANATSHVTDAEGRVTAKAEEAYVTIRAEVQGQTFERKAVVPQSEHANVTIDTSQTQQQEQTEGVDVSIFRLYWIHTAVFAIMVVAGVLTFLMRAPTLAFGGALLGAVATALPLLQGALRIDFVLACAACAFAAWTIRKNRARFRPLRAGRPAA